MLVAGVIIRLERQGPLLGQLLLYLRNMFQLGYDSADINHPWFNPNGLQTACCQRLETQFSNLTPPA